MNPADIHYQKIPRHDLFLQFHSYLQLDNIQQYNPLYSLFFMLNDTNYNSVHFNNKYHITRITNHASPSILAEVCPFVEKNRPSSSKVVPIFVKFAPLLNPIKYMLGQYVDPDVVNRLPRLHPSDKDDAISRKINNYNNAAFVDAFFVFLSSVLLNRRGLVNGVHFYGAFSAIQNRFKVNVSDDVDVLLTPSFFSEHINTLFFPSSSLAELMELHNSLDATKNVRVEGNITRTNQTAVALDMAETTEDISGLDWNIETVKETTVADTTAVPAEVGEIEDDLFDNASVSSRNASSCTSYTTIHSDLDEHPNESASLTSRSGSSSADSYINDDVFVSIHKFPVHAIIMEKCEDTLDNYILVTSDLPENEYLAIFMQIIFTLIAYQTAFSFVHNDLHAGNIMYVKTQHKYIYYKYNKHCYRVPTYGKLYKIIDFGRATYKCNVHSFCSDNYDNGEDAYGQYNYEPFMDVSKPRIAPHFGFDLCRLGCSIFDYIDKQFSATSRVHKVVSQWCVDDRGLNVLYKSSGEERYPGFKLYKMIVRTVHKPTPVAQLDVPEFAAFRVPKIKQASNVVTVDLDLLSPMYSTTA